MARIGQAAKQASAQTLKQQREALSKTAAGRKFLATKTIKQSKPNKAALAAAAAAAAEAAAAATAAVGKSGKTKNGGGVKKPHRWRPGTEALREIKRMQSRRDFMIPAARFQRYTRRQVKESPFLHVVEADIGTSDLRIQPAALDQLQLATEAFERKLYEFANHSAIHAKRVTVYPKDVQLAAEALENQYGSGR